MLNAISTWQFSLALPDKVTRRPVALGVPCRERSVFPFSSCQMCALASQPAASGSFLVTAFISCNEHFIPLKLICLCLLTTQLPLPRQNTPREGIIARPLKDVPRAHRRDGLGPSWVVAPLVSSKSSSGSRAQQDPTARTLHQGLSSNPGLT